MRIAIDAMGGDHGPGSIIDGALVAARHLQIGLLLVGARGVVDAELRRHPGATALDIETLDAPEWVEMAEPAAAALRRKPRASIRVAAEAVRNRRADALFSAGHTGAAVIAAHAAFGRLPGVDRPALATIVPTRGRPAVLLDCGATVECRPQHLVQFALLGSAYARLALGCESPRVGLLSVGEEESKGNPLTREAHKLLKSAPVRFIGNVEGRDVYAGGTDVIVCDGFTGNVTLKISEGLVETIERRGAVVDVWDASRLPPLAPGISTLPATSRLFRVWRCAAARSERPLHHRSRAVVAQGRAQRGPHGRALCGPTSRR